MNHVFQSRKIVLLAVLFFGGIASIAWRQADSTQPYHINYNRTTIDTSRPGKHSSTEYRVNDMDKAMEHLDLEMKKMDEEMKKVDFSEINKQVKEALANIDIDKIMLETQNALKEVDWKKIKLDVDKAMKEAEAGLKELDSEHFKNQMDSLRIKLKKENFAVKLDAEKMRDEAEQSMKKAKEEIAKAKLDLKNLKDFTNALDKDGLIDKKKDYKIKVEDGELFINGNKQSKETYEKYKPYYKKDNFSINSNAD